MKPITEADSLADLHPRPDNPSAEATAAQAAERAVQLPPLPAHPSAGPLICYRAGVPVCTDDQARAYATAYGQQCYEAGRAAVAALPAAPVLPEGWRAVPVEPTIAMLCDAVKAKEGPAVYKVMSASGLATLEAEAADQWAAMLAAAPALPAAPAPAAPSDAPAFVYDAKGRRYFAEGTAPAAPAVPTLPAGWVIARAPSQTITIRSPAGGISHLWPKDGCAMYGLCTALLDAGAAAAPAVPVHWQRLLDEARSVAYDEGGFIMEPDLAEAVDAVDAAHGIPQQPRGEG